MLQVTAGRLKLQAPVYRQGQFEYGRTNSATVSTIRAAIVTKSSQGDGFQTADEGWVPARRQRRDWTMGPNFHLSPEDAVQMQLRALKVNNEPWVDHGVEVLYRFAAFDPFKRSTYFGQSWDLGQFERFRRLARDKPYDVLLWHHHYEIASSLQVSDTQWTQRVQVEGVAWQSAVFSFHMRKRAGGRHDGVWFTERLLCDSIERH